MADQNGNFSGLLNLTCGSGWTGVYVTSTTAFGLAVKSNVMESPCEPSLVVTTDTYDCGGGATCWGRIQGSWLLPDAPVSSCSATPQQGCQGSSFVGSDGTFATALSLPCGANWTGVFAESTAVDNQPITSAVVDSPCG